MDPREAKVALVLSQQGRERLEYEPEGTELLLNPEVHIISYPIHSRDIFIDRLDALGLLSPGNMLIQSPFNPESYACADQASQVFALEKHFAFTQFCAFLGAKEVYVEDVVGLTEEAQDNSTLKGNYSAVKGSLIVNKERSDELRRKITLHDEFQGGAPDFVAAERLLIERRLRGDSNMVSLLELRQSINSLKSRKIRLSMTEESKRNLRVAASLRIPSFLRIAASHQESVKRIIEYNLTYRVNF